MKTEKIDSENFDIDEILVCILMECASQEEVVYFLEWIKREENRIYFDKFKKVWHLTSGIEVDRECFNDGLKEYCRFMKSQRSERRAGWFWRIASVAAVGLIAMVLVGWPRMPEEITLSENDLEIRQATEIVLTLSDGRKISMTRDTLSLPGEIKESIRLHKINPREIVYGVSDLLEEAVYFEKIYNEITVPSGERFTVQLSDGTKAWINSESSIRYPVCFGKDKREVEVRGNVYFEVAKDSSCPFIAVAREMRTEVLGTSFEVNTYGDHGRVSVTLVEGSVKVYAGERTFMIRPDQQFLFDTCNGRMEIAEVKAVDKVRWKDGMLVIDDEPFDELVRKLERWYGIRIVNETGIIFDQSFRGIFEKKDDIGVVMHSMCKNLNINYDIEGDRIILKR